MTVHFTERELDVMAVLWSQESATVAEVKERLDVDLAYTTVLSMLRILEEKGRYTGIRQAGPESLRHFKRTYKRALRRQIASREYNPRIPLVIPIREDKLYRSWRPVERPEANAVIVYMMDVSGSMTDEQKEIVRIAAFWIDTWLRSQYDGIETRYIVHDAEAWTVADCDYVTVKYQP